MPMLISHPRAEVLVSTAQKLAVPTSWQKNTPLAPENFWSCNVHCSSYTVSPWGLRGLTPQGVRSSLAALPSRLVTLRQAPQIHPTPCQGHHLCPVLRKREAFSTPASPFLLVMQALDV